MSRQCRVCSRDIESTGKRGRPAVVCEECRDRVRATKKRRNPQQKPVVATRQRSCGYCGNEGHDRRTCKDHKEQKRKGDKENYQAKLKQKKRDSNLPEVESYTRYKISIPRDSVAFGNLPIEDVWKKIESGRISGVFLESHLASCFCNLIAHDKQGENADLFFETQSFIRDVQAKTYRSSSQNTIFTTKSGVWDRNKKREDLKEITKKYLNKYDFFCYIDIEHFNYKEHYYSFIIVPVEKVKKIILEDQKHISVADLHSLIEKKVDLSNSLTTNC